MDSCDNIYGVDVNGTITPIMVRDAIIRCFIQAHAEILDLMKEYHEFSSDEEFEKMKQLDIKLLIQSKFDEVGGDFENPTKEQLLAVMEQLATFAANFRKPEIIKGHYKEIMKLVNNLS